VELVLLGCAVQELLAWLDRSLKKGAVGGTRVENFQEYVRIRGFTDLDDRIED
jgi:hypothetical protein